MYKNWNFCTKFIYHFQANPEIKKMEDRSETLTFNSLQSKDSIEQNQNLDN